MIFVYIFLDLFLSYTLAFVELHENLSKGKTVRKISRYYLPTFAVIVYMTQVSKLQLSKIIIYRLIS